MGTVAAMPHAHILLGTCEGAAYLPELLASLQAQTQRDWTLWVRDDASRDASLEIVRRAAAADSRIMILEEGGGRLGPAGNYGALLQRARQAGAEYFFFADQDDVRLCDKLQKQMEVLQREECGRRAGDTPLPRLVYSDMLVADERLRPLAASFLAASRLRHGEGRPMATLLGRNFVPGCACGFNRPVAELALPMPEEIASPDWWVALCAAAIGRICFLPEATVRYRRHAGTVSGPAGFWAGLSPRRYPWRERCAPAWTISAARFARRRSFATGCESAGPKRMRCSPSLTSSAAYFLSRTPRGGGSPSSGGWASRQSTPPGGCSTTSAYSAWGGKWPDRKSQIPKNFKWPKHQ